MSNKTAPILLAVVLGAVGLTPVFLKSFGDKPEVANVGLGKTGTATASNITAQSDDITKAGYSLGYMMGTNVAQSAKDLKQEDIIKGLQDGQAGKQAVLTREQMEQAVMAYQERQMKEMLDGNLAKGQQFLAENGKKAGVKTTASGLQYEVLVEGNGNVPSTTDKVRVHYTGTLPDGTVFDSSVARGQPAEFPVNGVIKGWIEALSMMPVGSKWRLAIPHELAYGERGAGAAIPPFSPLVFEVELLEIL